MKLNEYQEQAMRTKGSVDNITDALIIGGLGISGEAGEVTDYIKKVLYHGHEFDPNKIVKEIGDVMWYCAFLAEFIGVSLEEIASQNIEKLKQRYPNGFDSEKSINRVEDK